MTYLPAQVQPSKKPLLPEMGQASKLGHTPHPPSPYPPTGSSGPGGHRRHRRGPQSFSSSLDFLAKGQVLDSLQTVVEEATELMATMKTGRGAPGEGAGPRGAGPGWGGGHVPGPASVSGTPTTTHPAPAPHPPPRAASQLTGWTPTATWAPTVGAHCRPRGTNSCWRRTSNN